MVGASSLVPQALGALALTVLAGCDPLPPGRAEPYGPKLYVRGDFFLPTEAIADDEAANDASWEVCDERNHLRYVEKDRYEATIAITAGKHEFKIADKTWHAITLGGWPKAAAMKLETPYGMLLSEGSWNLVIEAPVSGKYRFTLHANNRHKPLLVVEPVAAE